MSFLEGSQNTFLDSALSRSGEFVGGLQKSVGEIANQRANGRREKALAALGAAGARSIIGNVFGADEGQSIPPAYEGNTDIEVPERDLWDTYQFANNFFFNETVLDDDTRYHNSHPMVRSMFLVDFEFNQNISTDLRMGTSYPRSMSFMLRGMDMPKPTIETHKINSYNHRKVFPKSMTYPPFNCRFGDITTTYREGNANISLMDLMQQYMSFYSNDFVKDNTTLHSGMASGRSEKNFIENINIYFFWSDGAKKITIRNPMITEFTYDSLDVTSDEQMTVSCNIEYEYIDMSKINITYDQFIEAAGRLADEIRDGLLFDTNIDNPYVDSDLLNPGEQAIDDSRRVELDNVAAQTALRLAELELLDAAGDGLRSSNPLVRAASEFGVRTGVDSVGGIAGGLGGLL